MRLLNNSTNKCFTLQHKAHVAVPLDFPPDTPTLELQRPNNDMQRCEKAAHSTNTGLILDDTANPGFMSSDCICRCVSVAYMPAFRVQNAGVFVGSPGVDCIYIFQV